MKIIIQDRRNELSESIIETREVDMEKWFTVFNSSYSLGLGIQIQDLNNDWHFIGSEVIKNSIIKIV